MIPEVEKPRITEIKVRMDCKGCVQKIKKALHGINGIYNLNIDFPQQKLTIIGWADPEKIVEAIKKTRRAATICSHSEPSDPPAQQTEPAPDQPKEQSPAPEVANPPPPTEAPPTEAAQPAEPPKEQQPPPPENPPPNADNGTSTSQPAQPTRLKNVEEVHVIYHLPPDDGYRYGYGYRYDYGDSYGHRYGGQSHSGHWKNYPNDPGFRQEPAPTNVTHSYNTHEPSPYVTHSYNTYKPSPYVTEYEYIRSPPRYMHYSDDCHDKNNGNGNITSMFSDENPNACRIV